MKSDWKSFIYEQIESELGIEVTDDTKYSAMGVSTSYWSNDDKRYECKELQIQLRIPENDDSYEETHYLITEITIAYSASAEVYCLIENAPFMDEIEDTGSYGSITDEMDIEGLVDWLKSLKDLNSSALPLGSLKNMVACSPGCPSNLV